MNKSILYKKTKMILKKKNSGMIHKKSKIYN